MGRMHSLRQRLSRCLVRHQRRDRQILSRHLCQQIVIGDIAMANAGMSEKYLAGLKSNDLLLNFTWEEWLAITPPYAERKFTSTEVTARYQRNGYDWDMHGTLYTPEQESD